LINTETIAVRSESIFNESDLIYAFTRADAIRDGTLLDISELAREVGIKFSLCVTSAVWHDVLERNDIPETDTVGRCWDMLTILRYAIKSASGSTDIVRIAPLFVMTPNKPPVPVLLRAQCHGGDNLEPVITIFKADEAD